MSNINNWTNLVDAVSQQSNGVFPKLQSKINQVIRSYQKSDKNFDMNTIKKNHQEIFNGLSILYEQLSIEEDITDIMVDVPSLTSNQNIMFNMIGVGKWIKIHGGNASRIFFFDEDKTMISDKSLADFLNRIVDVRSKYLYFGTEPVVYYKFKCQPSDDVVKYLKSFNIVSLTFEQKSDKVDYPKDIGNTVILDQPMLMTLCSNLSYGLCEKYYEETTDKVTKEIMVKNREDLENYLIGKKVLVNKYAYEQSEYKINVMGGPKEKEKFENLKKNLTIVPNDNNPRFYYLKDIELNCVSVAEREHGVIVTGNHKLENKLSIYYPEIPYKIFYGAQLVGTKYGQ